MFTRQEEVLVRVPQVQEVLAWVLEVLSRVTEVLEVFPQTSLQVEVLAWVPVMLRPHLTLPPGQGELCNVQTELGTFKNRIRGSCPGSVGHHPAEHIQSESSDPWLGMLSRKSNSLNALFTPFGAK